MLTSDYSHKSDGTKLACTYDKLATTVTVGSRVLVADGSLVLEVVATDPAAGEVTTKVLNNCDIGERKNMNLPNAKVELPVLQEKDIDDLTNFAVPQQIDFIAASFVQCADDIKYIRQILGDGPGRNIKIIAKIENQEGLDNFAEVLTKPRKNKHGRDGRDERRETRDARRETKDERREERRETRDERRERRRDGEEPHTLTLSLSQGRT